MAMAAAVASPPGTNLSSRHYQALLPLRGRSASAFPNCWKLRGAKIERTDRWLCQAYSNDVSVSVPTNTEWSQKVITLEPYRRGCHIITQKIYHAVPEVKSFQVGLANLFVMHTSASLTINENASPDVPLDMEDSLNKIVPEGHHYRHLDEGSDDMPAHVKSSMMGCALTIPIKDGRFCLGIWQGIWLNEHRNYGGPRNICITLQGVKRPDGRVYK
ncbi:hypothetical protein GOP47_0010103 [Adiantum capillus-veneris]|uniref:Uncharacterized protein n=1 Tax=Adiantum capillus-veneris TaxID=13818 RepID=A0A9D4UVC5_ADICA|nr:hypothetical protein GOP47_0010103 [Adiantum capillus-veneris]